MRLWASGRAAKIRLWLVTCTACTAKSSKTTPQTSAISDDCAKAMGSQDSVRIASEMPVTRCPKPWSAQRPDLLAARAPATPARPNRPMTVCESDSGGALNGSTMDVQSTEKAAKISKASRPLMRNTGSVMNSVKSERMSVG
ncbi:hypothetical protein D3C76_1246760 [compost metagenome]